MKLLDWMQHKFRQANNEHLTEFAPRNSCAYLTGQPSHDDLQYYPKSHYHAKAPNTTQTGGQFRKSFACMESARADNKQIEEESAADFSGLFHGFLAIGTLATETVTNEPATTFATSVENIMEKETEATENELKLINNELEKFLESEGKDDRTATITLDDKPSEEINNNENGQSVCPLQDYLFSSVVGLPETTTTKKEHRTSLGELFKTKMVDESGAKGNKVQKQKEKETEKSAVQLMKKILKGKTLYPSSKRSTADKKPRKILQMFNRKVHPECVPVAPESDNHLNEEYKISNQDEMLSEYITLYPTTGILKSSANCTKSHTPHSSCRMNDSDGNKECSIKSDEEFLVLEL
uniref:LAZY2 n=1 Tax=Chrysanthemum morifolium TaxID=41568 RepID=A0A6G6XDM1_CHRMO|nr:LAZY2 [Chrysanthemum x morifolium]